VDFHVTFGMLSYTSATSQIVQEPNYVLVACYGIRTWKKSGLF